MLVDCGAYKYGDETEDGHHGGPLSKIVLGFHKLLPE